MNAPEAPEQIISGLFDLEQGQWRWMGVEGVIALKPPAEAAPLEVSLYIPDASPVRGVRLELDGYQTMHTAQDARGPWWEMPGPDLVAEVLPGRRRVNLRSIVEGLEFIWIQQIILSLFLLDFGVTLVGFYRPILPILSADVFRTGASGLGILYAAPSFGSVLGSIGLLMAGDIKHKGIAVVLAAVFFAASLGLLGLSQWFWMAVAVVILLGITDAVSVAIRRTVVQLLAPDQMLGRASSLITVFAQATNGMGAIIAGTAAEFFGAPNALLIGSSVCMLMILTTVTCIPQLWRYKSD